MACRWYTVLAMMGRTAQAARIKEGLQCLELISKPQGTPQRRKIPQKRK